MRPTLPLAMSPKKTLTVSGTPSEPLEKLAVSISAKQPVTPKSTDTRTTPVGNKDNTLTACWPVPGNPPDGMPQTKLFRFYPRIDASKKSKTADGVNSCLYKSCPFVKAFSRLLLCLTWRFSLASDASFWYPREVLNKGCKTPQEETDKRKTK
jgi:hypothetical protein